MGKSQRYQRTVNIKDLLTNSSFADVMKKGLLLNDINRHIQKILPSQFHGLYQVANIDPQCLTIQVANAVVRQGFLFRQQELLTLIQQHYPEIHQLSIKLAPLLKNK